MSPYRIPHAPPEEPTRPPERSSKRLEVALACLMLLAIHAAPIFGAWVCAHYVTGWASNAGLCVCIVGCVLIASIWCE